MKEKKCVHVCELVCVCACVRESNVAYSLGSSLYCTQCDLVLWIPRKETTPLLWTRRNIQAIQCRKPVCSPSWPPVQVHPSTWWAVIYFSFWIISLVVLAWTFARWRIVDPSDCQKAENPCLIFCPYFVVKDEIMWQQGQLRGLATWAVTLDLTLRKTMPLI
jgi:hypothetical protein